MHTHTHIYSTFSPAEWILTKFWMYFFFVQFPSFPFVVANAKTNKLFSCLKKMRFFHFACSSSIFGCRCLKCVKWNEESMQCIVVVFDALYSTVKSHTNPKLYWKNIVFFSTFCDVNKLLVWNVYACNLVAPGMQSITTAITLQNMITCQQRQTKNYSFRFTWKQWKNFMEKKTNLWIQSDEHNKTKSHQYTQP